MAYHNRYRPTPEITPEPDYNIGSDVEAKGDSIGKYLNRLDIFKQYIEIEQQAEAYFTAITKAMSNCNMHPDIGEPQEAPRGQVAVQQVYPSIDYNPAPQTGTGRRTVVLKETLYYKGGQLLGRIPGLDVYQPDDSDGGERIEFTSDRSDLYALAGHGPEGGRDYMRNAMLGLTPMDIEALRDKILGQKGFIEGLHMAANSLDMPPLLTEEYFAGDNMPKN